MNPSYIIRTFSLLPLLSVLCLIGAAAAHHHAGCLIVKKIAGLSELSCEVCYRRKPNAPKSVGCGPLVSEQDKCRFYQYFKAVKRTRCALCEAGFALAIVNATCVPGILKGCLAEGVNLDNTRFCYGCRDGYAELTKNSSTSCVPLAEISDPVANCLYGGFYEKRGAITIANCYRCKAGFSLSFGSDACEKQKFVGCLRNSFDGTRCEECNVYDGYSQQPDFSCLKVGENSQPLV